MKILVWLMTSVWLVFGLITPAPASVQVTGEFTATETCQAYQSIRSRTNPGGMQLEIGNSYPIIELNVSPGTTWYRLRIDGANPAERWAYFECGTAKVTSWGRPSSGGGGHGAGAECKTAGLGDSYVFAVSWQPAFCEEHPDKPECAVTDPDAYQANNFALHGLWPNKKSCGIKYGFCGEYKKDKRPFCNFAPVPMQPETLQALGAVMPSAAHGSCLQRHEWYKHGTCQTNWDADGYFHISMRLLKEFNEGGMAAFMSDNIGETVTSRAFFEAVDKAFSEGAHQRLQIFCRGGKLVDVFISLPSDPIDDIPLGTLIQQADQKFKTTCGTHFEVDAIGQQ
jgi:ribonuclease T2